LDSASNATSIIHLETGEMVGAGDLVQSMDNEPHRVEGGTRGASRAAPDSPLVSVIVVVCGDCDELVALIDNIAPLRGSKLELVVVDGASSDGTLELLRARNDVVDYWLSEPDRGIYDAMNKGLDAARGQYILHLNAGDRLLAVPDEFLSECAAESIDVVSCRVLNDGCRIFDPRNAWSMRLYNVWHHQGTFYRRAAHLRYDPQYRVLGDFEHNQRMLKANKSLRTAAFIVAEHRTGGVSANDRAQREMYRAIRTHFGWGYAALAYGRSKLSALRGLFRKHPPSPPGNDYKVPIQPQLGSNSGSVSVVIVTHNSEAFISRLMETLEAQTRPPDLVVVVDSGSSNSDYLDRVRTSHLACTIVLKENVGFATACNIGWNLAVAHDYTLFLNPDAFLTPLYLEQAVKYMQGERHQRVGLLTGTLLGYDIDRGLPSGLVDSTGIEQTWFGRFYDRDQAKPLSALDRYIEANPVKAICGAAMFARQTALRSIAANGSVFESDFFMYKEDVDLSLKAARAGWALVHHPGLTAFHCRGWKSRKAMPKTLRLLSARNEIRMNLKYRSPFVLFSVVKYCLVTVFDI
jgi:GT2 family glycosyltransferase